MPVTARAAGFSRSGSGTAGDPYVITTPEQLNEVRNNLMTIAFAYLEGRKNV
jgi:hypothetical protein